jgi:hypothetical protein
MKMVEMVRSEKIARSLEDSRLALFQKVARQCSPLAPFLNQFSGYPGTNQPNGLV